MECFVSSILLEKVFCFDLCVLLSFFRVNLKCSLSFTMESSSLEELLESVYGEEFLSQQSQPSAVAPLSDEDDNSESDNETSSCELDPSTLARNLYSRATVRRKI